MQVVAGGCSNVGQVRPVNQDRYAVRTQRDAGDWDAVLMVADGMGGHQAGEVASGLAVDQVLETCHDNAALDRDPEKTLRQAIAEANSAIRHAASTSANLRGMGTTVTAALIRDSRLYIGHVGDSRLYLVRGESIFQLTHDHSWVAGEVRAGRLSAEHAERHPERHVLMQAVGGSGTLQAETAAYPLQHGDIVLLCTDGLSTLVNDQEVVEITRGYRQPSVAAEQLVAIANTRGAPDNVTAVVARVEDRVADSHATREFARPRGRLAARVSSRVVALMLMLVLVAVGAYALAGDSIGEFGR